MSLDETVLFAHLYYSDCCCWLCCRISVYWKTKTKILRLTLLIIIKMSRLLRQAFERLTLSLWYKPFGRLYYLQFFPRTTWWYANNDVRCSSFFTVNSPINQPWILFMQIRSRRRSSDDSWFDDVSHMFSHEHRKHKTPLWNKNHVTTI